MEKELCEVESVDPVVHVTCSNCQVYKILKALNYPSLKERDSQEHKTNVLLFIELSP